MDIKPEQLIQRLALALDARTAMIAESYQQAVRLFNGFYEGCPELVVDLYAHTLVLFNYAEQPEAADPVLMAGSEWLCQKLPWVQAVLVKTRNGEQLSDRQGNLIFGRLDQEVVEFGVRYALDLRINQDASFYLDTRNLRDWLLRNSAGKSVLNTFAYTGSLGAAAALSGAVRVVQTDRNAKFLALAQETYRLNGLVPAQQDFISGDFFRVTAGLKHDGRLFDLVILDAPFFSTGVSGRVDLNTESTRLINKVRPLVAHNGYLIVVNNALFLSGHEYLASLESTCAGGFMNVKTIIPVPADVSGYAETRLGAPPADPAPFNHSTKIVVLQVFRKDSAVSNLS